MRIRTIKPDFWTDEKVVELSPWARLLFIGLWNIADDHGRLIYSPRKIKLQLFPADSIEVGDLFRELIDRRLVLIYKNGDSTQYLQVKHFAEHQKIDKRSPSKIPDPHSIAPIPVDTRQVPLTSAELPQVPPDYPESRRVPPDPAESPRIPPPEVEVDVEVERKGTEGKNPSPAVASATSGFHAETNGIQKLPDPRFQPLVDAFHKHYPIVNEGQECPWSKREGNQAKLLLSALDPKTWTSAKLDRCVQFRLMSLNKPASEPPAAYMIHLPKYFEAPLDEYGKPDFRRADRWIAKQEKPPDVEPAPPGPPRVFKPDPALAELLEQLTNPWIPILGELKGRVNAHSFDTWLKPTSFAGVDARMIVVQVPTAEFRHIGDKWGSLISQAIEKLRMPFQGVEFWHQ
jgi:hypothetical protein